MSFFNKPASKPRNAAATSKDSTGGVTGASFLYRFDARRAILESMVIVLSILLAFGIDAWWEERREASDTRESIEVVRRDLVDLLAQLEEFEKFSTETAKASLASARALSGPQPVAVEDRPQLEALLLRATSRRTMRLPRAGYTDLLNTGNLAEINNSALRDTLVHFYEAADRSQEIVEKNSNLFTDLALKDVLIRPGLIMPWPLEDAATELQARRNEIMLNYMGPDFPRRPWRLWQLPPDSHELDAVVATLLQNARGATTAEVITSEIHTRAVEVIRQIDEYLADF